MTSTIGSLFTGAGMLDRAVEQVFGARTSWVSDIDKGACKVLGHRYLYAPNLGNITRVDWSTVPRVDIITGGSPCQDLSHAGRRGGMTEGTRSNLWVAMREAIATIRPSFVVWENVQGALSAEAASDLEHCPGCMGDSRHGRPVLRALGRVLGDLAALGFDAEWYGLPASDLGACHRRFRVFVLAYARGIGGHEALEHDGRSATAGDRASVLDERDRELVRPGPDGGLTLRLLPTPRTTDAKGMGPADLNRNTVQLRAVSALLPTPTTQEDHSGPSQATRNTPPLNAQVLMPDRWGEYAAAIARHEQAWGVPAPEPTEPGPKGNPRLSAKFVEWMMMQPAGWITDTPGITRNEALRLCGNGVVTPQAVHAIRVMLARTGTTNRDHLEDQ